MDLLSMVLFPYPNRQKPEAGGFQLQGQDYILHTTHCTLHTTYYILHITHGTQHATYYKVIPCLSNKELLANYSPD